MNKILIVRLIIVLLGIIFLVISPFTVREYNVSQVDGSGVDWINPHDGGLGTTTLPVLNESFMLNIKQIDVVVTQGPSEYNTTIPYNQNPVPFIVYQITHPFNITLYGYNGTKCSQTVSFPNGIPSTNYSVSAVFNLNGKWKSFGPPIIFNPENSTAVVNVTVFLIGIEIDNSTSLKLLSLGIASSVAGFILVGVSLYRKTVKLLNPNRQRPQRCQVT